MEPRLEFLIKLWSDSLERDLGQQAEAELEAMLQDADLVERFGAWQAERSATEGVEPSATPELDRRVRSSFKSRSWVYRHWPQLLAAAVGIAALGVFINALQPRQPDVLPMSVDEQPLQLEEGDAVGEPEPDRPASTPRPTLGLPPGFGQRPTRLATRLSKKVELRWTMGEDGEAEVRVLNARSRVIRTVWQGHAEPGRYRNSWNGKDDAGDLVEPGIYRLQARSQGELLQESPVEIVQRP